MNTTNQANGTVNEIANKNQSRSKGSKEIAAQVNTLDAQLKAMQEELYRGIGYRLHDERVKRRKKEMDCVEDFSPLIADVQTWSRFENAAKDRHISLFLLSEIHKKWGVDLNSLICGDEVKISPLPPQIIKELYEIATFFRDNFNF